MCPRTPRGHAVNHQETVMRIKVDATKCIGAGLCVVAAPEVFSQNEDDGLVIVLQEYPPQHLHEACREAARLCPALVISFDE
jgi:ferredoxin